MLPNYKWNTKNKNEKRFYKLQMESKNQNKNRAAKIKSDYGKP